MATTLAYWKLTFIQRSCMTQLTQRLIGMKKGRRSSTFPTGSRIGRSL